MALFVRTDSAGAAAASRPEPSVGRMRLRALLQNKAGMLGFSLFSVVVLISVFAPWLAPHQPAQADLAHKLLPPVWMEGGVSDYPLGTDYLGRDIWSRLIYGSRVSLIVGFCSVLVSGTIGIALGLAAGYCGRWIDIAIMRVVDALLSIPTILFMLLVMFIAGPGIGTLILVIGLTNWVGYARMVRGEVLGIRERDFVKSARAAGAGSFRIVFVHLLPNVLSSFIVISTMSVARVIIAEASLSFLGLGIQPPDVSWGGMLSDGRQYLATSWWVATFPGLAITVTVLSVIFIGDWLRDVLDPKLKHD